MKELEKNELMAIDGGSMVGDALRWCKRAAVNTWEWCVDQIDGLSELVS